jgi:hypothetical protein
MLTFKGPFVRFGPNRLSVNTAEGLQKIYGLQANTKKSSYYNVSADVFKGENVLTTIDNEAHSRKRKVFGAALSDRSVRSMEGTVLKHIRKFIQRLGEADSSTSSELNSGDWSSPKNMIHWASYFAFDVMGDICFSNSLDTLDKPDHRYLLDALPQGVNAINVVSHLVL